MRYAVKATVRCAQGSRKVRSLARFGATPRFIARKGGAATATRLAKAIDNFSSAWRGKVRPSRYTDGSYRVLYTATKPEVAKAERFFWLIKWFRASGKREAEDFFIYSCSAEGNCINFTRNWKKSKNLVHPSNYRYCRSIGDRSRRSGADFLIVPSARKLGGCCVPIFTRASAKVGAGSASFNVYWDARARKCYTLDVRGRRQYTTIDRVFSLI